MRVCMCVCVCVAEGWGDWLCVVVWIAHYKVFWPIAIFTVRKRENYERRIRVLVQVNGMPSICAIFFPSGKL